MDNEVNKVSGIDIFYKDIDLIQTIIYIWPEMPSKKHIPKYNLFD